jgi:hypothetical protein
MKNEKGFVEVLVAVVIVAVTIFALALFLNWQNNKTDKQCKSQFGSEWIGKTHIYSADMCVNAKGEVKYPL